MNINSFLVTDVCMYVYLLLSHMYVLFFFNPPCSLHILPAPRLYAGESSTHTDACIFTYLLEMSTTQSQIQLNSKSSIYCDT